MKKNHIKGCFGDDLNFLNQYINPIVLKDKNKQIVISSEFQGRILASTSQGINGTSYGWFNKKLISSDSIYQNISKVGGASRLWFGPDQGENNIFVEVNSKTNEVTNASPKDLDTLQFKILKKSVSSIVLGSKMHIKNLKHFHFYVDVKRKIELLDSEKIEANLNILLHDNLHFVAFSAETSMTNVGNENWTKEQGIISLWELGCMQPTPQTIIMIPLKGDINEATIYFTNIDSSRIKIENDILFYKADGAYFNKIGTLPENSLPYFGSYSPELNVLTVVKYSFTGESDYVNSHPEGTEPYKGDVINVFNDGPWEGMGPFGPFYELETSSPAKALKVGESLSHTHETYHFEGVEEDLNRISVEIFGVTLEIIKNAFL